ncbi:hypothetical protein AAE478_003730 [Parahypoxylon ruwenzoriense]
MIVGTSMPLIVVSIIIIISVAVSAQESLAVGRFFNPPNALAKPSLNFSTNPVWTIGAVETIKFTTVYSNYTINLWQQHQNGASATIGPTIFQTEFGAVTQFDWSVQVFEFDLRTSNVFFLWLESLVEGDGDDEPLSVTSHFFNITADSVNSNVSSSASSSTVTTTTATASCGEVPCSNSITATTSSTYSSPQEASPSLNTGAQAGIGIGAALVGLFAAAGAYFLIQRSRRKRGDENGDAELEMRVPKEEQGEEQWRKQLSQYPIELDTGRIYTVFGDPYPARELAELG